MDLIYKIIGLSILLAVLYGVGVIYAEIKKDEQIKKGKLILRTMVNMLKIILSFSIVCTGVIFLLLKPLIKLIS